MKTNENIHPAAAAPATRCRTGKIARLPLEIREQLNQRMHNGEPGKSLAEWLNSLPEVQSILVMQFQGYAIREQNISEWRKGGHQTWQQQLESRTDLNSFVETVVGLKSVAKDGITEPVAFFLAVKVALELKRLDSVPDGEQKAKAWQVLTARLVALRRGDIELGRLRLQQERYGLQQKTEQERKAEFWKWAEENINRDEFCRRRCYTYAERDAAINKILGITPVEQGDTVPENAEAPSASCQSDLDPASIRPNPT